MFIVVCIKQVPDTSKVTVDPATNTIVRENVPLIMNPYDRGALNEALALKRAYGLKVFALAMGPPGARQTLAQALSAGADAAFLASDRAYAGSDTLATGRVLSAAITKIKDEDSGGLAFVFCGKQTIDGDTAQVGPGIAARMGLFQLTFVSRIKGLDLEKRRVIVRRRLDDGYELVESPIPAMVSVDRAAKGANTPAPDREAEIIVWDNAVLGLDPETVGLKGSPTAVGRIFSPEPKKARIFGGPSRDAARGLIDELYSKGVLKT